MNFGAICANSYYKCDSSRGLDCLNRQGKLCKKDIDDSKIDVTCKCDCRDTINKYWNGHKCAAKLDFNDSCNDDKQCKFNKDLKCLYNHLYKSFKCQCYSNTQ